MQLLWETDAMLSERREARQAGDTVSSPASVYRLYGFQIWRLESGASQLSTRAWRWLRKLGVLTPSTLMSHQFPTAPSVAVGLGQGW